MKRNSISPSLGVTAAMKGNRRVDTRPEVALRSALHAEGLRFRKDYPVRISGMRMTRIDIAFPARRLAVFVDGCFWHSCPEHGHVPSTNTDYWPAKLARTKERDERQASGLAAEGWTVIRCWEHEAPASVVALIQRALGARPHSKT